MNIDSRGGLGYIVSGWYIFVPPGGTLLLRRLQINAGLDILAVIGVEFSPACAPTYLNKGRSIIKDKGIYIEELQQELKLQELQIPFIGINQRWHKKLEKQLNSILS